MTSAELWAKECHYEHLHQQQKLEWLTSLSKPDWLEKEMLRLTKNFLANPIGGSGGRFDLSDAARMVELDAFERKMEA